MPIHGFRNFGSFGSNDGLSIQSPGNSALELKQLFGYNTNGIYYINLNGVSTPVFCIMDSAYNGGGWMMMMKATTGTTFNYSSSYWTSNNTLNATDTTQNNADAKFDVMNYFPAKDMMARWPDIGSGGSIAGLGSWIWLENEFNGPSTTIPITFFSTVGAASGMAFNFGGRGLFKRDAKTFGGWAAGTFSSQPDIRFYGFNYENYPNPSYPRQGKVRWGFGWNENAEGLYPSSDVVAKGSNDVSAGIGMDVTFGSFSAGDKVNCCQDQSGINRSARVEVYVR